MRRNLPLAVVLLVVALAISAQAAPMAYMTVSGTMQGQFKGDATAKDHKDAILVLRFNLELTSPHDAATGNPTGKVMYKPLVITKGINATSPQFFQALVAHENLPSVTLQLVKPGSDGKESIYYTIKLAGVSISNIRQYTEADAAGGQGNSFEDISFSYDKIEVEGGGMTSLGGPSKSAPSTIRVPLHRPQ